jgi:hypothetical protein
MLVTRLCAKRSATRSIASFSRSENVAAVALYS